MGDNGFACVGSNQVHVQSAEFTTGPRIFSFPYKFGSPEATIMLWKALLTGSAFQNFVSSPSQINLAAGRLLTININLGKKERKKAT